MPTFLKRGKYPEVLPKAMLWYGRPLRRSSPTSRSRATLPCGSCPKSSTMVAADVPADRCGDPGRPHESLSKRP